MIRLICVAAISLVLASAPCLAAGDAIAPVHHNVDARFDPGSGKLELTDVLMVSGRAILEFRLAPWLAVEGLLLDGQQTDLTDNGGVWRVPLPDSGMHRLELRLRGVVPPLPADGGRSALPSAVSGEEGSYLSGYAGWKPGQLEAEVEKGYWLLREADTEILFNTEPGLIWRKLLDSPDRGYPVNLMKNKSVI